MVMTLPVPIKQNVINQFRRLGPEATAMLYLISNYMHNLKETSEKITNSDIKIAYEELLKDPVFQSHESNKDNSKIIPINAFQPVHQLIIGTFEITAVFKFLDETISENTFFASLQKRYKTLKNKLVFPSRR